MTDDVKMQRQISQRIMDLQQRYHELAIKTNANHWVCCNKQ